MQTTEEMFCRISSLGLYGLIGARVANIARNSALGGKQYSDDEVMEFVHAYADGKRKEAGDPAGFVIAPEKQADFRRVTLGFFHDQQSKAA